MSNSWAVERILEIAEELRDGSANLYEVAEELQEDVLGWMLPVGTEEYPPDRWYVAQFHTPSEHTGIDINLDKAPWGDVERGFPIWAIADGVVIQVGYSSGWLGVVVVEHQHQGKPLFVRYAHLEEELAVDEGDEVVAGDLLGRLGDWRTGDHLHFDMAGERFVWSEWLTNRQWLDPMSVLKAHIDPSFVEAMARRG